MNISQFGKWIIVAGMLTGASLPVAANECEELSALRTSLGEDGYFERDHWEELDKLKADNRDKRRTKRNRNVTIDELELLSEGRFRSGTGVRHSCKGPASDRRVETVEFDLDEFSTKEFSDGIVRLRAMEDSRHTVRSAEINVPPSPLWKRTAEDILETSHFYRRVVRNQSPVFATQNNLPNGPFIRPSTFFPNQGIHYSFLVEIETQVQKSAGGLAVSKTTYVNGHKVEWTTWKLKS